MADAKLNAVNETLNGTQTISVREWTEQFRKITESRNLKPKTLLEYDKYLKVINLHMGDRAVRALETRDVAAFLSQWVKKGKTTMANRVRSLMVGLFREAMAEGIITNNPAEATRNQRVAVQRERMTLDEWKIIRQAAGSLPAWAGGCFDLAIVTGQRLSDIQAMRREDYRNGRLYIRQKKTDVMIAISETTRLDCLNLSLSDVLKTLSFPESAAHIVTDEKGQALTSAKISKAFRDARNKSGLEWAGSPPSFHEIRSLSARLYTREKGKEYAQKLLGHKSSAMTDRYRDARGAEWMEV